MQLLSLDNPSDILQSDEVSKKGVNYKGNEGCQNQKLQMSVKLYFFCNELHTKINVVKSKQWGAIQT